jgi:hypothetical protein
MKTRNRRQPFGPAILAAGAISFFAATMLAQVQTQTSTTHGTPSHAVTVDQGEVAYVSGNDLMVKMADGTLRDFPNVSESARVTVDGKQLGIHDLKVGMKLQRTITTTTTPRTVTTVQNVTGKVWHVTPPSSVILTLEDGTNQQFTIPKGQKFNVNGQMTDAWALKKGMSVTATKVVETPETVVSIHTAVTGTMPPPPDSPILVEVTPKSGSAAAPVETASAEPAPAKLPKTASSLPLVGMTGLAFLALGFGIRLFRRA